MSHLDEKRRLTELYAALSDDELQKLARDADSLTLTAREVLEEEMDRRDLDEEAAPSVIKDEMEVRRPVTVRNFRDLPEALLAKGMLDSADIRCFLADDNLVRLDWFISNFIGGIKLQVDPDDVEAAREILDQPIPPQIDFQGASEYEQPRCPNCFSLDISFEELNKPVAYVSAYFGVPIPLPRQTWVCHSCGKRWHEVSDGNESALGPA
ncbi:MAG TPA: DUF2007 domain-containing protein [Terriglobales bacterium]|jgi:hypothetical protein